MKTMKLSLISCFLLLFVVPTFADTVAEVTNRMEARLSSIDSMKMAGKVGESSGGYLVARESVSGRESSLIESENSDRRILYKIVADKTGQRVSEVGQQRAIRIAQQSRSGIWIQKKSGEWIKKP